MEGFFDYNFPEPKLIWMKPGIKPISTIFEAKDVNRCLHVHNSEKFPNFCAGVFQVPKNS